MSEDRVWDIVHDDSDEQEILLLNCCVNEPHDSEMEAEFVRPPGLVNSQVGPSERSRKGMFYRGASGDNTFNESKRRVQFLTERGKLMAMTFLVSKVTTPLASLL